MHNFYITFLNDEEIDKILVSEKSMIEALDILKKMDIKVKGRNYDEVANDILTKLAMNDFVHKDWFAKRIVVGEVPLKTIVNHRNTQSDKITLDINDTEIQGHMGNNGFVWKVVDKGKTQGVLTYNAETKKVSVEGEIPYWLMQKASRFVEMF